MVLAFSGPVALAQMQGYGGPPQPPPEPMSEKPPEATSPLPSYSGEAVDEIDKQGEVSKGIP